MNPDRLRFRAWDAFVGDWDYFVMGSDLSTNESYRYRSHCKASDKFYQSTGLSDCDGQEIFEGDIVVETWISKEDPRIVGWWNGEFRMCSFSMWEKNNGMPGPKASGNMWYRRLTGIFSNVPKSSIKVMGNIVEGGPQ